MDVGRWQAECLLLLSSSWGRHVACAGLSAPLAGGGQAGTGRGPAPRGFAKRGQWIVTNVPPNRLSAVVSARLYYPEVYGLKTGREFCFEGVY
jgi:hypothetical protein